MTTNLQNCHLFAKNKSLLGTSLAGMWLHRILFIPVTKNAHQCFCSNSALTQLIQLRCHENIQPVIGSGVQQQDWREPVALEDWDGQTCNQTCFDLAAKHLNSHSAAFSDSCVRFKVVFFSKTKHGFVFYLLPLFLWEAAWQVTDMKNSRKHKNWLSNASSLLPLGGDKWQQHHSYRCWPHS